MARVSTDISTFVASSINMTTTVSSVLATLLAIVGFGWHLDPQLTVIWLASAPLYYLLPLLLRHNIKDLGERSRQTWSAATTTLLMAARGSDTLKVLGTANAINAGVLEWIRAGRASFKESFVNGLVSLGQSTLQNLMTIVVLIAGIDAALTHRVGVGTVMAFVLLQQKLGSAVLAMATIPIARSYAMLSVERLDAYYASNCYELPGEREAVTALTVSDVAVTVNERLLASQVCLEVNRNEIILILGANGAGKTQLLRALLGLRETASGTIAWAEDYKRRVAYIPQDVPVFKGDLRSNLTLGRTIDDHTLRTTAKIVGWSTAGFDGRDMGDLELSGGELKRLALARALLSRPLAAIVDEIEAGVHEPESLIEVIVREVPMVIASTHRPDLWPAMATRYEIKAGRLRLV